jgi:NAD(P)-dependent dehydrogenase (short-subunit alcohol dehydrogenase family)
MLRQRLRSIPLGRLGHVDDIAGVAAFLASDDSAFMIGETISPNGGYLTV